MATPDAKRDAPSNDAGTDAGTDVFEQAKRLAETLAADARTQELRQAIAAVDADPEARAIHDEYTAAVDVIQRRAEAGQPIEPEQKRAAEAAGQKIRRSPPLQRMLRAHQAYAEMMDAVHHILGGGEPGGEEGEHEHGPGCSHDHAGAEHGHDRREEEPPQKSVLWTP